MNQENEQENQHVEIPQVFQKKNIKKMEKIELEKKIKELEENQLRLLENLPKIIKNIIDVEYPEIKKNQELKKLFKGKGVKF